MWNWMELHDSLLPALFQVMVITTLTIAINVFSREQYLYLLMKKVRPRGWLTQGHGDSDQVGMRSQILELPSLSHSGG